MVQPPLPLADLEFILEQTAQLWHEVRGRKLFITGGTGFFGVWLLESLLHINRALALNVRATVLTRNPAAFTKRVPHIANAESITLHAGDMTSFEYPRGEFAYVIHAATDVANVADNSMNRLTSIQDGTAHVLRFAATHGTQKFLLTSSGAVYGPQPMHITHVPENYSGAPVTTDVASAYGEGKRVSELLCAYYAGSTSIECKIARCFAFGGPGLALDANFAIGNFIADVRRGRPVSVVGDGTPIRSYLYAADLTVWLWTILLRGPSLDPLNVGSEDAISISELAHRIVAVLNPSLEVIVSEQAPKDQMPPRYVPSTEKARRLMLLRSTVDLDETIRRMAAWHGIKAK